MSLLMDEVFGVFSEVMIFYISTCFFSDCFRFSPVSFLGSMSLVQRRSRFDSDF